jgi:hypothetical protein
VSDLTASTDIVETAHISKDDEKEAPPARFDPAELTHEVAALLSSVLRKAEYECAKRIPQAGGNRWYSEPIRLATYAAGGINCWKESPCKYLFGHAEAGQGRVARQTFRSVFFHRGVGRERINRRLMKMNWTFWRKAEFSASPGSR